MVDETVLYGMLGVIAVYIALRWLLTRRLQRSTGAAIERELADVLHGDEYKVKGRFE